MATQRNSKLCMWEIKRVHVHKTQGLLTKIYCWKYNKQDQQLRMYITLNAHIIFLESSPVFVGLLYTGRAQITCTGHMFTLASLENYC